MTKKNSTVLESAKAVENVSAASVPTMKLSEAKRVILDEFNAEFSTPFKVMNFINKNRNKPAYKVVFEKFLIQDNDGKLRKICLDDLLKITQDDGNGQLIDTFCRLSSVDKKGVALSQYEDKDGKIWYYIPVPFSVNGFFSSLQGLFSYRKKRSAQIAWAADEDKRKEYEKKQREKLRNKVTELSSNELYVGLSEAQILQIARDITGVRLSLS